ncbi:MAG: hypothetical protein ACYCWW_00535 [Deltaproteobacteria bacterium]
MARLLIVVPEARDRCGRAVVLGGDGQSLLGPFRVLATASPRVAARHGNPDRDPMRRFGNPPSGSYVIASVLAPGTSHRRPVRFGPLGGFVLDATGGQAAEAQRRGREAIVLHGGPKDRRQRLRPTRGGLRLSDADLSALVTVINERQAAEDPLSAIELMDAPEESLTPPPVEDALGGRRLPRALIRQRGTRRAARGASAAPGPLAPVSLALLAGLGGSAGERSPMNRRRFLQAALVLVGGLSSAGCVARSEWCSERLDGGDGGEICGDNSAVAASSGYASGDVAGGG